MESKIIKVLKQTKNFQITLTKRFWYEHQAKLYDQLEINIDDQWVAVRWYPHVEDGESEAFTIAENFDYDQGWFQVDGHGHPLDHFDSEFKYDFGDNQKQKVKNWTKLDPIFFEHKKGYTRFSGNHTEVSAYFSYIIWDGALIEKIKEEISNCR